MVLDFDRCVQEIDKARQRAESVVRGFTPEQLTTQPAPGKWSIAECILHLNATAAVVQPLIEKAIVQGKRNNTVGRGPFSIGPKGRLMVWIAEPPPKFRIRAPKNVRPPAAIDDPSQILPVFMKAQDEWERLMREQQGLDLAGIKVGQGAFRMRLAAALPWMMAHQRRHLLQAENVKRQIVSAAPMTTAQAS
jgi:hypothetical protein